MGGCYVWCGKEVGVSGRISSRIQREGKVAKDGVGEIV